MNGSRNENTPANEAPRTQPDRTWANPLRGRTFRFRFHDGPAKGGSYDHTFHDDDTVTWRDSSARKRRAPNARTPKRADAERESAAEYGAYQVADDVYVVSYLSKSGYTLTVALNFETDELYGFASNSDKWYRVQGVFEVVSA